METKTQARGLGFFGTLLGLLALAAAVFHFFFGPIEPPPPLENVVAETATRLKDALAASLDGREYKAPPKPTHYGIDKLIDHSVIVVGFFAVALGVLGFVQHETWRPSGAALVLGSAAIAFQFAVAIVATVLGVILIVLILNSLDIL
jgi:hypothetical protein